MLLSNITDVHTHIFTPDVYDSYVHKAGGRVRKIITIQYWTDNQPARYPLRETLLPFAESKGMKVIAAVNAHFSIEHQLTELRDLRKRIVGVKMYPGYQPIYPTDEKVCRVAQFCTEQKLPLMLHCGCMSARGKPLLKYAHPYEADELAVRFPECKIVLAHFGFPHILECATVLSKNKNVYADISGTIDKLPTKEDTAKLVRRYSEDLARAVEYFPDIKKRILFGTDYSGEHTHLNVFDSYVNVVAQVFDSGESRDVFANNAETLFWS